MDRITVKLIGENGNVFNIIGIVSRELKRAGRREEAAAFTKAAMAAGSYDAVLALVMETVDVE
jgi:hypothetical protein